MHDKDVAIDTEGHTIALSPMRHRQYYVIAYTTKDQGQDKTTLFVQTAAISLDPSASIPGALHEP